MGYDETTVLPSIHGDYGDTETRSIAEPPIATKEGMR